MIGRLTLETPLRRPGVRRVVLAGAIIVSAVLTFYPQQYRSAVTVAPADPTLYGLGGTLNQLGAGGGAGNSLFGNQAAVEVTLRVAASMPVRDEVIDKVGLIKRENLSSRLKAHRWLDREVTARSLRGNIVQIDTKQSDPELAEDLMNAYYSAVRNRLSVLTEQQTAYKRTVLKRLVAQSNEEYMKAQAAYDNFRNTNRYAEPSRDIDSLGSRALALRNAIKGKEIELNTARQFATDQNFSVQKILAEQNELKRQLAAQQELNPDANTVSRAVQQSTQAQRLERDLFLARTLYEVYNRFLQGTTVEDLTSSANMRVIEPPFIDTKRQMNIPFLALTILLVLLAGAIEFYSLRPPLEAREA